ncbi:MAG: alpha/beta fold hydrolase [Candidatus Latescibacteria bacterium]|nr:alpha/beta fold hydrolase [Candidatus Latescibacterota bacterium]
MSERTNEAMNQEKVRIDRGEGRPLAGDLHSPARPIAGVVVVHGFKGFKDWGFFPYLCDRLAEAGFAALRVNLSGCGIRSEGEMFDAPDAFENQNLPADVADIGEACRFLAGRLREVAAGGLPIALLGHSRGGGAALVHAAEDPGLAALVTWSAVARFDRYGPEAVAAWERGETVPVTNARTGQTFHLQPRFWTTYAADRSRYDLLARAAALAHPWLIVHGAADETVPVEEARELHRVAESGPTRLVEIPGGSHTYGAVHPFEGAPEPLQQATQETVAWLRERLSGA